MSSFTLGNTIYRFRGKHLTDVSTPNKPQDATNLFYDKHISTALDKYKAQELHMKRLNDIKEDQRLIKHLGSRGSLSLSRNAPHKGDSHTPTLNSGRLHYQVDEKTEKFKQRLQKQRQNHRQFRMTEHISELYK